ncbi:hypothetical protein K435DRAFT_775090 [Dendrothele bispora CBS 962.96]|uniref:Zn(2)-C6 fungal-type domain-containing protein n=1 Tax=Dendrothele bispora (strain CBS 962.96) TaxID=1314807 RepID=A0A4S8MKH8_DENBC|nr:hypothetical protein K435DRAFT_775090 [Dendrothele bispora CBS 962.96]
MSNQYSQWNSHYNPQLEHAYAPGFGNPLLNNDYPYNSDPSQSSSYASNSRNDAYMSNPNYLQQQQYPSLPSSYDFQPAGMPTVNSFRNANGASASRPRALPQDRLGNDSYYAQSSTGKRQRVHDRMDEPKDEEGDVEAIPEHKEGTKGRPGACARCKSLKVRCEFKTDTDPCKRCFNGGHECVIPGRKKRRTPPKREHLLAEIQKQAEEIKKLMAKLETRKDSRRTSTENLSEVASPPVLSPTSSSYGLEVPSTTNKAVEDWFAKAKDSLADFDGFIGMGGATLPKRYIIAPDPEDSGDGEESDYYSDARSDFDTEDSRLDISAADSDAEDGDAGSNAGSARTRPKTAKKAGGKMATLPSEAAPFGLMADLSLRTHKRLEGSDEEAPGDGKNLGVANADFFRGPTPDPKSRNPDIMQQAPHILARGIITPEEIEPLFKIFFDLINPSISLVDPVLYTPEKTVYRSPFLFTVICAVSSRFYSVRPEIYPQAMQYAQLAAGTALISGPKNVEMCIAYIVLSLYQPPFKRWEDSRGWLYLGLAIRIAVDLNLHLPNTARPQNEFHAREQLNRTRVWLNCFNLDRSTGSQYGKAPIIPNSDYLACHSETWWNSSQWNMKNFDIQLCCYNSELRVMAEFMRKIHNNPQHPTGLNKEVDFEKLATDTDEELLRLEQHWFPILDANVDQSDRQGCFRTGLLKLAFSYARLIALSYGFQHAFGKNNSDENPFFTRCLIAATDVVKAMVENIGQPEQRIYLRHGPEAQSVFTTFAAAFLVKLLQPKFSSYLDDQTRSEIRNRVQNVIDFFSSPDIALDNRHGPKLYARFLKGLLASPMVTGNGPPRRRSHQPASSVSPGGGGGVGGSHGGVNMHNSSFGSHTTMDHPSPATTSSTHSLSPPPSQEALSFEHFAPISEGVIDPFQSSLGPDPMRTNHQQSHHHRDDFGMRMQEDFNVYQQQQGMALPDGDDLLGMNSISDPSHWQGVAVPGYNWLAEFQNDVQMRTSGFNNNMYGQNMQYM